MAERRKQVEVTEEHHDLLHRIARRRGDSLSQVVHEALELFLTEVVPDPDEAPEETAESRREPTSPDPNPKAPSSDESAEA